MPYTLTEEEKARFREQYLRNVRTINEYLPISLRLSEDLKALNRRLNDPQEQRLYKKSLELKEREDRREDIYNQLNDENKHLRTKGKTYALDRVISYQFAMQDDRNAPQYNENVVRNYYLHPEAMVQHQLTKVLNFNPSDIAKIGQSKDAENMLIEFYDKNAEICEYGYQLKGALAAFNSNVVGDDVQKYIKSTASSYEVLETASDVIKSVTEDSFYPIPSLNREQMHYIENSDLMVEHGEIYNAIHSKARCDELRDVSLKEFKSFIKGVNKRGFNLNKDGAFNNLVAVKRENGEEIYIPFLNSIVGGSGFVADEFIVLEDAEANKQKTIFKRDFIKEENFVQNEFVPTHANDYRTKIENFKYKYAINLNVPLYKMDKMSMNDIIERHKGGFFEKMFGTTSKEFKDVITQFENFEDMNSNTYHDTTQLSQASQRYLDYKGVKTYEDIMKLSGTSKDRALLCWSVVQTCKREEINNSFAKDYVQVPEKPIDADINDLQNGKPVFVNIINKEMAIKDKDILEDKIDQTTIKQDYNNSIPVDEKVIDEIELGQ